MQRLPQATKPAKKSDSLDCARAIVDALPSVMWFIRKNMRKHRSAGLSVPQFRALALLARFPCATLSTVAEHLGTTHPSASRLVSGMVKKGLVRRADASCDRRKLSLEVTAKGQADLEKARNQTHEDVAVVLAHLKSGDKACIHEAMTNLKEVFEAVTCCGTESQHDDDGGEETMSVGRHKTLRPNPKSARKKAQRGMD